MYGRQTSGKSRLWAGFEQKLFVEFAAMY